MPVVINSGSGNQGIACSVPLIVYAREMELPDYVLYRALVFSNLLTVYQKQYIGKLSAFCVRYPHPVQPVRGLPTWEVANFQ